MCEALTKPQQIPLSSMRMKAGMPSVGAISHEAVPVSDTRTLTMAVI